MPHKQLAFVVFSCEGPILLHLTFCSAAPPAPPPRSLPLSCSHPLPFLRPSVRWGAPCPVLWQACQACIWPSGVQCWEAASSVRRASGLHRVSPGVFLFLSLWLVVGLLGAQASPYHPAPATPDLTTAGGADTHTRAHKLPFCPLFTLYDVRISSCMCHHWPMTPSVCVDWFLQRNSSSFTQCGF